MKAQTAIRVVLPQEVLPENQPIGKTLQVHPDNTDIGFHTRYGSLGAVVTVDLEPDAILTLNRTASAVIESLDGEAQVVYLSEDAFIEIETETR